jgi:hypothetical protein
MSKWISVKDRLPEDGWRILLYCDVPDEYGKERIGVYLGGKYWEIIGGEYYTLKDTMKRITRKKIIVTHWMPLPEPPESEE